MSILLITLISIMSLLSLGLIAINISNLRALKPSIEKNSEGEKYSPKVLVILPIKGIDLGLDKNLSSLKDQSYQNHDIIAVVDSESDSSIPYLNSAGIKHIISNYNCKRCSGKVRAISTALFIFPNYDVYVVADSDIRVERDWLMKLIVPLSDTNTGISTSFPKFYPEGGFWSQVKMVWGLVGESMMSSELTRFAWGGSLAFKKELLDDGFLDVFSENISDDIALLKRAKEKGMKVNYVSDVKIYVHSDDDFEKFAEWSNRQTALSISGSKKVFLFGSIYFLSIILLMITSIILAIFYSIYFALFLIVPIYIAIVNYRKVPKRSLSVIPITFLLFFIYIANLMIGYRRKEIKWRGGTYKLYENKN